MSSKLSKSIVLIPILSLVLTACAPNLMGGASASDVVGNLEAVYEGSLSDVFNAGQQTLYQAPGWSVAADNAGSGYMRVEQTSMRARMFAAPINVTEFVTLTATGSSGGTTTVSVAYTASGANLAQNVVAALDARFGRR